MRSRRSAAAVSVMADGTRYVVTFSAIVVKMRSCALLVRVDSRGGLAFSPALVVGESSGALPVKPLHDPGPIYGADFGSSVGGASGVATSSGFGELQSLCRIHPLSVAASGAHRRSVSLRQ
jgi:hypothetical protein